MLSHIEPELFVPFTFIFLTIAIGMLGASVMSRLSKAGSSGSRREDRYPVTRLSRRWSW